MLIPDYKKGGDVAAPEFTNFVELDQYKKVRTATTDKVICVLFAAPEWDDASRVLKDMLTERVRQGFGAETILFSWVDCDSAEDLVEHFDVESVPSLVVVMPHKQQAEVVAGISPDQLTEKVTQLDIFVKTLFEQEK